MTQLGRWMPSSSSVPSATLLILVYFYHATCFKMHCCLLQVSKGHCRISLLQSFTPHSYCLLFKRYSLKAHQVRFQLPHSTFSCSHTFSRSYTETSPWSMLMTVFLSLPRKLLFCKLFFICFVCLFCFCHIRACSTFRLNVSFIISSAENTLLPKEQEKNLYNKANSLVTRCGKSLLVETDLHSATR